VSNEKESWSQIPDAGPTVIVIAPPELSSRIAHLIDAEVVAFRTLDDLDRWRTARADRHTGSHIDLVAALEELGSPLAALPDKLRRMFEAFIHHGVVPSVNELEQHWPSRRSFYRTWRECMAESPSSFLRRARALHAKRLLASGVAAKEAALIAGFSSVDRMRRQLARKG
jgi:AraC-like DNA-binding protein